MPVYLNKQTFQRGLAPLKRCQQRSYHARPVANRSHNTGRAFARSRKADTLFIRRWIGNGVAFLLRLGGLFV
jgi:hypothetical protein